MSFLSSRSHKLQSRSKISPHIYNKFSDVVVEVKACGMVPNLANVLNNWETWYPHQPLPPKPAIFGLDPAGVVTEVGDQVVAIKPGDRVYVNPLRSCGACYSCVSGQQAKCEYFTFNGYFGFNMKSLEIYKRYPVGDLHSSWLRPKTQLSRFQTTCPFHKPRAWVILVPPIPHSKKLAHLPENQ